MSIIYFPLLAAGVTRQFATELGIWELADEEPALGVYEANTPWGGSVRRSPLPVSGLGKGWQKVGEGTLIRGENYS